MIRSPLDPRFANQISATRHAALLQFQLTGSDQRLATTVVPVLAAVHAAAAAHPQIQIAETGDATITKAINDTVLTDLHRAEALSFPITLVVLLIAFGAVVAALLPLGLATLAILAANGLVAFTSHLSGVTVQASSVMLLIGLAVGVDYSMFYVKRQREERAAGQVGPGRDRGGGRHVGPLGADLGADRPAGDVRHVPDRQQDLLRDRAGHDAGRGRRRRGFTDPAACPARLARRPGRPGAAAADQQAAPAGRPEPGLVRGTRPGPGPPRTDHRRCGGRADRARAAGAPPAHRDAWRQRPAAAHCRAADVQPDPAGVPRWRLAGRRRGRGARHYVTGGARRGRCLRAGCAGEWSDAPADRGNPQCRAHRRDHRGPARRHRGRCGLGRGARRPCGTRSSRPRWARAGRPGRGDRRNGRYGGLQRAHAAALGLGLRVRPAAGIPAAARLVPLTGHPGHGRDP